MSKFYFSNVYVWSPTLSQISLKNSFGKLFCFCLFICLFICLVVRSFVRLFVFFFFHIFAEIKMMRKLMQLSVKIHLPFSPGGNLKQLISGVLQQKQRKVRQQNSQHCHSKSKRNILTIYGLIFTFRGFLSML